MADATTEPSAQSDHRMRTGMSNPLHYERDIVELVMCFVGNDSFLFVASVSTRWKDTWGRRPKVTSCRWAVQSCSCFDWATACNLHIWDGPCLHAAAEGRLDVLQHLEAAGYIPEFMPICEYAAGSGHLEVVRWSRAKGYPWGRSNQKAAEGGHLGVLKWCVANGCPLDVGRSSRSGDAVGVIAAAARGGHLETVRWCREQGYPWPSEACHAAVAGGHFELLRWLRAKGCPWSQCVMSAAVAVGDLEMLEWCGANGCPWPKNICETAAQYGNLGVLRWCITNSVHHQTGTALCCTAAFYGHLEMVQRLRADGYPWGRNVCYAAASSGHFRVLQWCVQNGCPWESTICSFSCPAGGFKGTVPTMIWAVANQCPWMDIEDDFHRICQQAVTGGNLRVLQWCSMYRRLKIPMVSRVAASEGHVHILEWLRASGWLSDRRTLEWLRSRGSLSLTETDSRLCEVGAKAGSLGVVKWCKANKYPWGKRTSRMAAHSGNMKLLQWCRTDRKSVV